jgi:thiamine phosphate synthase YjbQ (UPF0047 family)
MKIYQKEIKLRAFTCSFHIITDLVKDEILEIEDLEQGILQVFIKHTSASLTINEN